VVPNSGNQPVLAEEFNHVVWTDSNSNFAEKSLVKTAFTVPGAIKHLQKLDGKGKSAAAEYVWRAPEYVRTPPRDALESAPWFAKPS
jgi:hypothetical protein